MLQESCRCGDVPRDLSGVPRGAIAAPRSPDICAHYLALALATLLSVIGLPQVAEGAGPVAYYVATNGNDSWTGTIATATGTDGPFRTIARAQGAVRAAIAGGMSGDVTVFIRGGEHYQDSPIWFLPEDSGRDGYKVVYRAYPGERPVIHRAQRVTAWQPEAGGVYKTPIDWTFNALWENGVRASMARHPNVTPESPYNYSRTSATIAGAETTKFGFRAGDVPPVPNPSALEVVLWPGGPDGTWNWVQQVFSVASVDYGAGVLTLGRDLIDGGTAAVWTIGAKSRYFVQGARELLDSPGEFWLGGGFLYYRPRRLPIEAQEILIPGASQQYNEGIVSIHGASDANTVHDLEFEGLTLAYTNSPGSGFLVHDAERIGIRGNRVHDVGGNGVAMHGASRDCVVAGNLMHDVGRDAVNLYGEAAIGFPRGNLVTNNHLHHVGRIRGDNNGITVVRSADNVVSHNLIHDSPREGIGVFGSLSREGAPVQNTTGNIIAYNDISRTMTDSQDGAPIHVGGIGPGNSITGNRIHHSDLAFSYGNGIYLDITNMQTTVSDNVIHDLQQSTPEGITYAAIHVTGDGANVVNNVVAGNRLNTAAVNIVATQESEAHLPTRNTTVKRNIFSRNRVSNVYAFPEFDESQLALADLNLFHHPDGMYTVGFNWDAITYFDPRQETLAQWRERHDRRHDQNSATADPRFVDFDRRDFRLRPDSPAYALGFEDIDYAAMGLTAEFPFATSSEPIDRLFVTTAQSGPSATVRLATDAKAQIQVSARTTTGYLVTPTVVTYASDQPTVAAVDPAGVITAGATGLATITVTATSGGSTISTVMFVVVAGQPQPANNYGGLWWAAPAGSESGWGINFAHQGDIIFATWFTYDATGKPWWLIADLHRAATNTYTGSVSTVRGVPFDATPWDTTRIVETVIGTMTATFGDADNGTLNYAVNGSSQTKQITRQVFGPAPNCVWGMQADLALAVNYQDLWWVPGGAESGWGINFTHQGEIIFATWFTYNAAGAPWWLIAELHKTAAGVYSGPVSTVTGPAFDAVPFDPAKVSETQVGTATVAFANGNSASFAYTVNAISQTKALTRQVFASPGTVCH